MLIWRKPVLYQCLQSFFTSPLTQLRPWDWEPRINQSTFIYTALNRIYRHFETLSKKRKQQIRLETSKISPLCSIWEISTFKIKSKHVPRRGPKPAFIGAWACSLLRDSPGHRSFAGLTTQTKAHHNEFDKGLQFVYRETRQPPSDIGVDVINISLRHFFFFWLETAVSTATEWNHAALSSLMKAEIWYELGKLVGECNSTSVILVNYTEGNTCKAWSRRRVMSQPVFILHLHYQSKVGTHLLSYRIFFILTT